MPVPILLDQIPKRRAPIPWLLTIPSLLLNVGFHKVQEVVSLKPAKMPDEPDWPNKIAAVLKLFEVQGHHDLEEFLGSVIEGHHGRSNGAGGSSRPQLTLVQSAA